MRWGIIMETLLHGVVMTAIVVLLVASGITLGRKMAFKLRPGCSETSSPAETWVPINAPDEVNTAGRSDGTRQRFRRITS
jgi:hypothetical protein